MTTLYTVARADGEGREINLTIAEAARAILHYDGQDYEIRREPDGDGWRLWQRQQVANRPWHPVLIWSFAETESEAEAEMLAEVVEKSSAWQDQIGGLAAQTMDAYLAESE
jgi:hypothetical protein